MSATSSPPSAARPPWAPPGEQIWTRKGWPDVKEEERKGNMVRVAAFHADHPSPAALEAHGAWVVWQAKEIWARMEESTENVYIRYDNLFGNIRMDPVKVISHWELCRDFKKLYPFAMQPYANGFSNQFNVACGVEADVVAKGGYEDMLRRACPADKEDPEGFLSYAIQPLEMREAETRAAWKARFS